jgi:hypothetical protein
LVNDQRKIVIEYGTSSLDELLNIAATGIAAMMFAKMNSQTMITPGQSINDTIMRDREGKNNESRVISGTNEVNQRSRIPNII